MGNPLLLLGLGPGQRRLEHQAVNGLRQVQVPVPVYAQGTDAVFVVLRRLRTPLTLLIVIFAVSAAGLAAIPARDEAGQTVRMSVFDAIYVMSYTATTIGFGEIPFTFSAAQRMWVTVTIFASVIGWAYTVGTVLALTQDAGLRQLWGRQRFARRVRSLREPFVIIAGCGQAGRLVAQRLDQRGQRFVLLDGNQSQVEALEQLPLATSAVAISADSRDPAMLGLAGLGHRWCRGVLALTDNDEVNLAVVMSVQLLRPELPVSARCHDRAIAARMQNFAAEAVINPYDRFGSYLLLALHRPETLRLTSWLMSEPGTALQAQRSGLAQGRWVVCADGQFGVEVAHDLRREGIDVHLIHPTQPAAHGVPDMDDHHVELLRSAAGFLAGTDSDTANIAVAAKARLAKNDLFICVRQQTHRNNALLQAFAPDAVFVPTELISQEVVARVITPRFWGFIDHAMRQDDQWSGQVVEAIVARCGTASPEPVLVEVDAVHAPAAWRWMQQHPLRVGALLCDPDERTRTVSAFALVLVRQGQPHYIPNESTPLCPGDQLVLLTTGHAWDIVQSVLFYDTAVEYVATGVKRPSTWVMRRLRAHAAQANEGE